MRVDEIDLDFILKEFASLQAHLKKLIRAISKVGKISIMSGVAEADKKKVCIIGGGPCGLAALRRVLDSPQLTGTVFEQRDDVGGLWNYVGSKVFPTSPKHLKEGQVSDKDPECVSTMYDNLR